MPLAPHIQRSLASRRANKRLAGAARAYQEPYRAGSRQRASRSWMPPRLSADAAIAAAGDLITDRIRDLGRNDPFARAGQRKVVLRSVGTGIECKSAVRRDGELFEEHNSEVDALFERWSRRQADVRGKRNLYRLQRVIANELEGPGEALVLRCYRNDPGRLIPLCYQPLEGEQLDARMHRPPSDNENEIVRGVELDRYGTPVAYWLFDRHPADVHPLAMAVSRPIPAERVIHLYDWERPSQTRGVTPYTTTAQTSRDLDWFVANTLKSAHIQSLFTVLLKRANGQQGTGLGLEAAHPAGQGPSSPTDLDWTLPQIERLGSAIVADMGQFDDLQTIAPSQPGPQMEPFVKLLLLILAAGRGLSYVGLTGDYSQTNYSSAKAAGNDDDQLISVIQHDFCDDFVEEVFRDFVTFAAAGELLTYCTPEQFLSDPEHWLQCTWHPPGRGMVDEDKESKAALLRIFSGQSTFQRELARRGLDYREVFAQLEREWKDLASRGVTINLQSLAMALASVADRMPDAGVAA